MGVVGVMVWRLWGYWQRAKGREEGSRVEGNMREGREENRMEFV